MHSRNIFQKFCSGILLLSILSTFSFDVFAINTRLSTAELSNLEAVGGLSTGYNYWDTTLGIYKTAIAPNKLELLTIPTGSLVTNVQLAALKGANQIVPHRLYWNSDTKNYVEGATTSSSTGLKNKGTHKTTSELDVLRNNKSATPKVFYWDTLLRKYFMGGNDNSLVELKTKEIKNITLTFSSVPTTVSVAPAVLKYDKHFASSFTFDDGYGSIFRNVFNLMRGGYNTVDETLHPGLFYTDGAGNDVAFTAGEAWFDRNASEYKKLHTEQSEHWMKPSEMQEMLDYGWDIIHHGLTSAAFRSSRIANGDPDIQYPVPYGPDPLNYSYEISGGEEAIREEFGITPTTFIAPSGDNDYREAAYAAGYRMITARNGDFSINGNSYSVAAQALPVNNVDTDDLVMVYRPSYADNNFDPSNMMAYTQQTAGLSNQNDHYWMAESTHQVKEFSNGGSIIYSTMKQYLQSLANIYGKGGSDTIWFAGVQEVYEYLLLRNTVGISTMQNGNTVTVSIDVTNVPENLRYKALSLKVDANASLLNVAYDSGDFKHFSHNINTGLVNIDWSSRLAKLADKYVSIAEETRLQSDVQVAQQFTNKITDMLSKMPYQTRINAIEINTDKIFYVDVGNNLFSYETMNNWNNVTPTQLSVSGLQDSVGGITPYNLDIVGYTAVNAGVNSEAVATLYPYSAMRDSFEVNPGSPLELRFTNLSNTRQYSFKIYGGRMYGDQAPTDYTIGTTTVRLEAKDNTDQISEISGVMATNGEIVLTVSTTGTWGFINAVELIETDLSGESCFDSEKNQDETDVDCGGAICGGCALTKICSENNDCANKNCVDSTCVVFPTCSDGIKNQDETDIDCGGSVCGKCELVKDCLVDSDCISNNCDTGVCGVVVGPVAKWYLDLGMDGFYETNDFGWNNITINSSERSVSNAIDSINTLTGVGFAATGYFSLGGGYLNNGVGYPTHATKDGCQIDTGELPLTITVSGLENTAEYDFIFFGAKHGGNSALTKYSIGSESVVLQAQGNTDQSVMISDITPTAGTIIITVAPESGEVWGFLGTLEMHQH